MGFIRRTAALASRKLCLKRTITVGGKKLPLIVSPDAQLKYLKPGKVSFDYDLIQIAETFVSENSTVWDVGANVGVFTFASASIASSGIIVSIEADIWLASLLRRTRNMRAYSDRDIRIIPVALSSGNGVAEFQIASRGRASNALKEVGGRSTMGGVRELQYVPTLALDTLLESQPRPDFVKIDVEGAEGLVLKGATRLLNEIRPICYIEVGSDLAVEIFNTFLDAGYQGFTAGCEPLQNRCVDNNFFVPSEKIEAFKALKRDGEGGQWGQSIKRKDHFFLSCLTRTRSARRQAIDGL